jgi:hypothetical protein
MLRRLPFAVALASSLVFSLALAAAGAPAQAQGIFDRGTVALGAERLFGATLSKASTEANGRRTSVSRADIGLFTIVPQTMNPYSIPRLGLDFAVADAVTIGAALGYATGKDETRTEQNGTSTTREGPRSTFFVVEPRAGYALGVGDRAAVWLRGGLTYFRASTSAEVLSSQIRVTTWGFALSLEPALVFMPVNHFGISVGLVADLPLTGKAESRITGGNTTNETRTDRSIRNIGLAFGLVGTF